MADFQDQTSTTQSVGNPTESVADPETTKNDADSLTSGNNDGSALEPIAPAQDLAQAQFTTPTNANKANKSAEINFLAKAVGAFKFDQAVTKHNQK